MPTLGSLGYACELKAGGTVIGKAKNVNGPRCKADTADVTTRGGSGWKEFKQSLKEWDADVEQLWVADDAGVIVLMDAYLQGTELTCRFVDESGNGFTGLAIVTSMDFNQPLGDAVTMPIGLKGTGALTKLTHNS